jgi:hypothetical protein
MSFKTMQENNNGIAMGFRKAPVQIYKIAIPKFQTLPLLGNVPDLSDQAGINSS